MIDPRRLSCVSHSVYHIAYPSVIIRKRYVCICCPLGIMIGVFCSRALLGRNSHHGIFLSKDKSAVSLLVTFSSILLFVGPVYAVQHAINPSCITKAGSTSCGVGINPPTSATLDGGYQWASEELITTILSSSPKFTKGPGIYTTARLLISKTSSIKYQPLAIPASRNKIHIETCHYQHA
jgi:hypothetical protein